MGIHFSVSAKGIGSDFLWIWVWNSKEKLVDRREAVGEETLDIKTSAPRQALRVQAFIVVEIERAFNMFFFVDLVLYGCFMNIIVESS